MSMVDLLVRELIQNSLDAKLSRDNGQVLVDFDIFEPGKEVVDAWRSTLGDSLVGQWVSKFLDEKWCVLRVTDRGTTGLNGPVDAFSESDDPEPPRFQRVAFKFGQPDNSNLVAGGSWGVGGKTVVFRMAASLGLVAYYSRPHSDEPSRFIGVHCFDHSGRESELKKHFDGFAWWGAKTPQGQVNGMIGSDADQYARALGCDTAPDFRGTQILIPLPLSALRAILPIEIGGVSDLKRQMIRLRDEIQLSTNRWWWPRLSGRVDEDGNRTRSDLGVRVTLGISPLSNRGVQECINPQLHHFYSKFVNLYLCTFRESDARKKIRRQKCGAYLLGYVCREVIDDKGLDGDFVLEEWTRMGVLGGSWAIAQVRNSGLVVSYFPSLKMRAGREASGLSLTSTEAGLPLAVVRINGHCAVRKTQGGAEGDLKLESVFRAAENSAHSEWSYNLVSDRSEELGDWACKYISQTYQGIKELFVEKNAPDQSAVVTAKDLEALAQVSHELGRLLPLDWSGDPTIKPLPVNSDNGSLEGGAGGGAEGSGAGAGASDRAKQRGRAELVQLESSGVKNEFLMTIKVTGIDSRAIELCVLDVRGKVIDLSTWGAYSKGEPYPLCLKDKDGINHLELEPGTHSVVVYIKGDWFVSVKEMRR
jgi:hypothetical protein